MCKSICVAIHLVSSSVLGGATKSQNRGRYLYIQNPYTCPSLDTHKGANEILHHSLDCPSHSCLAGHCSEQKYASCPQQA